MGFSHSAARPLGSTCMSGSHAKQEGGTGCGLRWPPGGWLRGLPNGWSDGLGGGGAGGRCSGREISVT